jgi:IclR family acetate operon transcriptional repressor
MSTIGKALSLLEQLSRLRHDVGLSEMASRCALDPATARRYLCELERHGYVEHIPETRKYRIGAMPVHLARVREERFPFLQTAVPVATFLSGVIGETVHVSQCIGERLSVIHVEHPQRANRVHVEIGDHLPWHATASGLAVLAASPAWFVDSVLTNPLAAFTKHTQTDHTQLRLAIQDAIDLGFAVNLQGLDEGVVSFAAAIGEPGAGPVGAISIAAPLERFERATMLDLGQKVAASAHQISCSLFWISSR